MSIEIKQMVVKSNVVQRCESSDEQGETAAEETRKQEILEACKRLILETMQEMKER
jgi:hypothetical protein